MEMKLFDSELRLMELLWAHPQDAQPLTAKEISLLAAQQIGWNKNTTYTVIKKLVDKNAIRREEPGFQCIPLISRSQAQRQETRSLLQKLFGFTVQGWTTLMGSIWMIGGIQLFCLGMIGEYIGKIYMEVKERPRYNIEKILN